MRALLWKPLAENKVHCRLCNQYCVIAPGERGLCGVRENVGGELHTLVGDRVAAAHLDPVEKKPLFHFYPGTTTFSFGTMGCNLSCGFCQNFSLSQPPREGKPIQGEQVTPERLVEAALAAGASSMSYTYSEPTIFWELAKPTAQLARKKGLKNILVTNGFMSDEALADMDGLAMNGLIDAANVDLKAFTEGFYKDLCGARLAPVLKNLKAMRRDLGWWVEATTLVIPGKNDSPEELGRIAAYLSDEVGPEVPWHVSRFHPDFRMMDVGHTPTATLEKALEIGRKAGLKYVYVGNLPAHDGENTHCPDCGQPAIVRRGFRVVGANLKGGICSCGSRLDGVGLETLDGFAA